MQLIDSHAHLTEDRFDEDREALLARALAAGVETIGVIGYNLDSSVRVVDLLARHEGAPRLFGTVGFAPHNVDEADAGSLARVRALVAAPGIVAVGEIGLDYHYDMPPDAQRALFGAQLGWAVETGLPVVIHSREAEDDVVSMIGDAGAGPAPDAPLRGVIHCFTESVAMARAVVQLGFYVSFSGILTFKNAADIREAAAAVPLDRLLIETDAPYLAPVPHRGKRNEPAFVGEVARCLAEVHGTTAEAIAQATTSNARTLFRLG